MKTEMLVECLDLTKNFSGKKALDAVNRRLAEARLSAFWDQTAAAKLH